MRSNRDHDDSTVEDLSGEGWRDDDVIRVLLVDDQELIRTGFALILSTSGAGGGPSVEVVGEAGDGVHALRVMQRLAEQDRLPNVVLMDVRMPGMDGIEATRLIVRDYPDSRVLVLTTFDLDEYALAAIEAGAGGFLLKDARAPELVAAVRSVAEGDAVMAASLTRRLISRLRDGAEPIGNPQGPNPNGSGRATADVRDGARSTEDAAAILERLTDRERDVFALIAEGLTNAEIGDRLFLSVSTVKTHVGRVLTKLELRDRVHAVILAYEAGVR